MLEKILEEIIEQLKAEGCIEDNEAGNRAVEIIRKNIPETDTNDGWIPVEDGLPGFGDDEKYPASLVALKDGEVCIGVYRHVEECWLTRRVEGERRYTEEHEVVAWQPLPEPYKTNKGEGK